MSCKNSGKFRNIHRNFTLFYKYEIVCNVDSDADLWVLVYPGVGEDGVVGHDAVQVRPVLDRLHLAELSVPTVS